MNQCFEIQAKNAVFRGDGSIFGAKVQKDYWKFGMVYGLHRLAASRDVEARPVRSSYLLTQKKILIMNVDNAKSQMRKGMLEYCVLLLLSREASYANDIIVRLKQAELIVVEGTLYPLLTRLKKDGLLSYEWRESTQGPPRKYYALTDNGRMFLAELDGAWYELARTVDLLKTMAPELPPIPQPENTGTETENATAETEVFVTKPENSEAETETFEAKP